MNKNAYSDQELNISEENQMPNVSTPKNSTKLMIQNPVNVPKKILNALSDTTEMMTIVVSPCPKDSEEKNKNLKPNPLPLVTDSIPFLPDIKEYKEIIVKEELTQGPKDLNVLKKKTLISNFN